MPSASVVSNARLTLSLAIISDGSDMDAMVSATFIAIAITVVATWLIFRYGSYILLKLGRVGIMAFSRVLGLLLAAVGVQFVLNGIAAWIPHV